MILEAAETGHLVICTLQAWNVAQNVRPFLRREKWVRT